MSLFTRVAETQRASITFSLDGRSVTALAGDTVLTAVLTQADSLRLSEFSGKPRAGFCLIGACQDCWMRTEDGQPVRACSTEIQSGMRLLSAVSGGARE
ncbi:(2Fe-2S)-binding protein [Collimonas sp.]|jgi:predicted molibdopterin-dependent oxidoreductase YjgC|uniref:(2Fe-2S)-binding protein n=1 Tax=Collimonas sp. TaxID=1963772 RepID=UPI002C43B4A8|nr:(2Fe-2S)-binding protein [Collimonas sp.]HWW04552.1 (2Fe-2S)-binding protein [Collimonas sp.]